MDIVLKPIGVVVEGIPRKDELKNLPRDKRSKYKFISTLQIFDEYLDGLLGLEEYSHCIIIWYMHMENDTVLKVRPWGDQSLPIVGIFATRFPPRPNKVALTVVEILEVSPPYLKVRGLDAWSGSPIIDIKPYDYYDIVKNPRVPKWFHERWLRWYKEKEYDKYVPWLGP